MTSGKKLAEKGKDLAVGECKDIQLTDKRGRPTVKMRLCRIDKNQLELKSKKK